jgi:hypothetical protein
VRLSSVLLARSLAFIDVLELNPRGEMSTQDITAEIVKRYKFQKFPKTLEDFKEAREKTGLEFETGRIGSRVIHKLTIWDTLITVETRSNTDDSKQITDEILLWAADKLGLAYKPGMITHWAYVSDITFYSDVPILDASPPLKAVAEKTSRALSDIWQEPIQYYPINLSAGHDPTARKQGIAPFTITRRAESKFSENKYFSEAPLPTDMHIAFLKEFEADVTRRGESPAR